MPKKELRKYRFSGESSKRIEEFGIQRVARIASAPDAAEEPAETPEFTIVARTDKGKVRRTNQDMPIVGDRLAGVADGMGGHKGGETASETAANAVIEALRGETMSEDALREAIQNANTAVRLKSQTDAALEGMGTTLTALWLGENEICLGHCGDSRCYRYAGGKLEQISDDHSLVMEMVRAGVLTKEQAAVHPMRNVITRAVGTDEILEVDTKRMPRHKGDLWLCCSDGLSGMVSDEEIAEILSKASSDEAAADALVAAALEAGGHDNVTVVLLHDLRGAAESEA